ncbi:hypothetical protein [Pseudoalteromonas rubra]|nr:hypothetical protein [Pseudoalteromonas rubra]MEC4090815.1 hypothetical protein [Pseudoalteromonas rubra]
MQITYVFALTLGMFTCALAFATEVDFALLDDNSDGALSAKEFKHFNKHL